MGPEETASQDPRGEVFDLRELIGDRFASSVFGAPYIVEAREGNVLTCQDHGLAAQEPKRTWGKCHSTLTLRPLAPHIDIRSPVISGVAVDPSVET